MLVIDENMFRLAKMQETLLKVSTSNIEENLRKYIKTVTEIDAKAYEYIMEKAKHIDEHSHSLEEELEVLKEFNSIYEELNNLQSNFKDNCKKYGNKEIKLSNLFDLNIDYMINRMNSISEYLMNVENIEKNKERIQELNEKLIDEEKKKDILDRKLQELEDSLVSDFGSIEGRAIVDGKLEYTNISIEYDKINLDFNRLCNDKEYLNSSLSYMRKEKNEVSEKVKVAEVCYSSMPNIESKQILDEINLEYLRIKYKLTMLEIAELLFKKCNTYDEFIEKRKSIIDLVKYRLVCMECLGIDISIDPFGRIKLKEQLETVQALTDNSKVISNIKKEISTLNTWTEDMISQNNKYLITINVSEKLIKDKTSLNDIDITSTISFDELSLRQDVSDNQVVRVRNIGSKFNINIVSQKTLNVIKRVSQMMDEDRSLIKKEEIVEQPIVKEKDEVVPELLIVPVVQEVKEENLSVDNTIENTVEDIFMDEPLVEEMEDEVIFEEVETDDVFEEKKEEVSNSLEQIVVDSSISVVPEPVADIFSEPVQLFESVTPFEAPTLFADRAEEEEPKKIENVGEPVIFNETEFVKPVELNNDINVLSTVNNDNNNNVAVPNSNDILPNDLDDIMPDVFWVTQSDNNNNEKEEEGPSNVLSFDEQINALLSYDSNDKVKKKAA